MHGLRPVCRLQLQELKLSLTDGVLPRTPKPRMVQRTKAELQRLLSLSLSFLSQQQIHSTQAGHTSETHHGCQAKHTRRESQAETEGAMTLSNGRLGPSRHLSRSQPPRDSSDKGRCSGLQADPK